MSAPTRNLQEFCAFSSCLSPSALLSFGSERSPGIGSRAGRVPDPAEVEGGVIMRTWVLVVIGVVVLAGGMAAMRPQRHVPALVAGGTEVRVGEWVPGEGSIAPGARIRGWSADFQDTLVGPAGDLATGSGPVTMNCDLDDTVTGPCWGGLHLRHRDRNLGRRLAGNVQLRDWCRELQGARPREWRAQRDDPRERRGLPRLRGVADRRRLHLLDGEEPTGFLAKLRLTPAPGGTPSRTGRSRGS